MQLEALLCKSVFHLLCIERYIVSASEDIHAIDCDDAMNMCFLAWFAVQTVHVLCHRVYTRLTVVTKLACVGDNRITYELLKQIIYVHFVADILLLSTYSKIDCLTE